ncbi:hypothetical protein B1400_1024 [Bifidobacterium italicum]|uniref:MrfA-like Zn-binding domain-containing protein n=1 Tax=Bifidobacterium italicum TaxID=1960968 RepID=A0A2A2EJS3_9BIFI|nr:DUF1998 domain-containing protein [Bifidobacterium italicum]PAU69283.1 hypothetical protein B1400_1024 [Bifidobacterium italicum]
MSEQENAGEVKAPEAWIYDSTNAVNPLDDEERLRGIGKNYAKVGGARGTTLLYTYGPGAIMDMPHFTVMPMGLDDWQRIWARRNGVPTVEAQRLLENVQLMLGPHVTELRPFPWQPNPDGKARQGDDLGVPARIFPQWLRCTGCDLLAPVSTFADGYTNTNPYRPDRAEFVHKNCRGRSGRKKLKNQVCVSARYLLVCENGHMDEFPYDWWVHKGEPCPEAEHPQLRMRESSRSEVGARIDCVSCGARRSMREAQGSENRAKLPRCRGRMPHLNAFAPNGCDRMPRLMLIGASNLWFPVVQSIIDMPQLDKKSMMREHYNALLSVCHGSAEMLTKAATDVHMFSALSLMVSSFVEQGDKNADKNIARVLRGVAESESELRSLVVEVQKLREPTEEELRKAKAAWEPVDLLVPEWEYLNHNDFKDGRVSDDQSGLTIRNQQVTRTLRDMGVQRLLAVDRLRKVNALIGFTRVDDFDRANDPGSRFVHLNRESTVNWVPATEDFGEGVFIQFDEGRIAEWQERILGTPLWNAYVKAHRRNFYNRFSETARDVDPDTRLPRPRYWLLHTLSHALIKRMALSSGYGMASLTERLYAWDAKDERPAAAGILISTTASDSDGTLGGLVALGEPETFEQIMEEALWEMRRCSSDPICAQRVPQDPEDFLHGASCHCCCMLSETSCERANRFLDRRFIVPLPGEYEHGSYKDCAFFLVDKDMG